MSKESVLKEQLVQSEEANKALMERLLKLDTEYQELKDVLKDESTRIRIPNQLNSIQFNELVDHLNKIRSQFVEALEKNIPTKLSIVRDNESASQVN